MIFKYFNLSYSYLPIHQHWYQPVTKIRKLLDCGYPQTGFLLLSFCDAVFNINAFLGFQSPGLTLVSRVRFISSITDAITAEFEVLNSLPAVSFSINTKLIE